jgi:hypothetical protein
MLRRVALVRTDVSEELVPSSPILVTLMKEALSSSETSVLTRSARRDIPKDGILHIHRRENLSSYILDHLSNIAFRQEELWPVSVFSVAGLQSLSCTSAIVVMTATEI